MMDECFPACIRDTRWFMWLPHKLAFGRNSKQLLDFKKYAHTLSYKEYQKIYANLGASVIDRDTDLNEKCIYRIANNIKGKTVLDVGCGKGFLLKKLAKKHKATGADVYINPAIEKENAEIKFVKADLEQSLPFGNKAFDTVVCTHTLEHVRNLSKSISELRRVAKQRLIIVIPQQRYFKYTLDLHLNFFPYPEALQLVMGKKDSICEVVDGDLYYQEEL